jgi:hypothetical protein
VLVAPAAGAPGEPAADLMAAFSNRTDVLLGVPFQVDSIHPAPAPDGSAGTWFRYIVTQGSTNTITGIRSGTREEVVERIEAMVVTLNERRLGKYKPASKGRPPARMLQKRTEPPPE